MKRQANESIRSLGNGETKLHPFDYKGVALGDGNLKRQFDETRDFNLRIPNDDLLRGYRLRAGRPAPGADLGGHYLDNNTFGQILSGLSRMYAATGDAACKEKAEALLSGWAECLEPDGFFFIVREPTLPHYYYDKIVYGLLDLHLYCGSKDALDYLSRVTDWAIKNLNRAKLYARPTGLDGGEWYTLSENLYRAYLATGDKKYRDFAEFWEYREFWDLFAGKADIFQHPMNGGWYHAYSHVNSLNSLAATYLAQGKVDDLETLKAAWDFLWSTQLWATGGYGPNETLMPRVELAKMLSEKKGHFETQCGSWAVFKLAKYLMSFTGDAQYGDWAELMILNGIGASIPMDADGKVFYFSEYHLSGSVKRNINPWACCSGTRVQSVADFHDLIYLKDADNLHVNLFAPSTVEWDRAGGKVTVTQSTRFPETPRTQLDIAVNRPVKFSVNVRVPGWLAEPMKAWINGAPVSARQDSLHWARFDRIWSQGDQLVVEFPMAFRTSGMTPGSVHPAAILYGPVTMAVRSQAGNPARLIDLANLSNVLTPVDGQPINYHLASDPSVLVRPFYQFKAGEPYFLYLDHQYEDAEKAAQPKDGK